MPQQNKSRLSGTAYGDHLRFDLAAGREKLGYAVDHTFAFMTRNLFFRN
jgi:hypothetical protein